MKNLFYLLFTSAIVVGCGSEKIIIDGSLLNIGNNNIKIYVRDSSTEKRLVGETQAIDDKFSFELKGIKTPVYAYLATIGSEVQFVLEPGVIKIANGGDYTATVSGTKYNDMLYKWKSSPEAIKTDSSAALLNELIRAPDYESQSAEQHEVVRREYGKIRYERSILERKALEEMFTNSDEYGQLFSILYSYRTSEKNIEALNRIEKVVGKNGEIDFFREVYSDAQAAKNQTERLNIGNDFVDFSAVKTDENTLKLSDVVAKNRLTMLEFWASWCAPCRAEMPHMKEVYEKHKSQGFEIFSFSVDAKKEEWLKAEKAENLPWISTSGDVDAVSKLYVVVSVPASILIDGNGKIVAKNLRGDKLDKFVENFLK